MFAAGTLHTADATQGGRLVAVPDLPLCHMHLVSPHLIAPHRPLQSLEIGVQQLFPVQMLLYPGDAAWRESCKPS